jgi:hypothetical protein
VPSLLHRLSDLDGLDTLLQGIAVYRKKDVALADEQVLCTCPRVYMSCLRCCRVRTCAFLIVLNSRADTLLRLFAEMTWIVGSCSGPVLCHWYAMRRCDVNFVLSVSMHNSVSVVEH